MDHAWRRPWHVALLLQLLVVWQVLAKARFNWLHEAIATSALPGWLKGTIEQLLQPMPSHSQASGFWRFAAYLGCSCDAEGACRLSR